MQISNIQDTNFTGRYKMLISNGEYEVFKEKVVPVLEKTFGKNYSFLYGKSPVNRYYMESADTFIKNAKNQKHAAEKLKNIGIRVTNPQYRTLWLSTGKKDALEFETVQAFSEICFLSRLGFANMKIFDKCRREIFSEMMLSAIKLSAETENKYFTSFINHRPFTKVSNFNELLGKILSPEKIK